jgi:hypothetical protein
LTLGLDYLFAVFQSGIVTADDDQIDDDEDGKDDDDEVELDEIDIRFLHHLSSPPNSSQCTRNHSYMTQISVLSQRYDTDLSFLFRSTRPKTPPKRWWETTPFVGKVWFATEVPSKVIIAGICASSLV